MLHRLGLVLAIRLVAAPGSPLAAQDDALARAPSRFAMLDGARIHYKSLGLGRSAVVLVHCWACDMNVWQSQVPVLEGRIRIIALDLPGHGRSDKPAIAYTMAHYATAVDAVLRAAGVERAYLVGHSMGVPVIREYYRRFPAKTAALVAVDGWLVAPGADSAAIERQVKRFEGPGVPDLWAQMIDPMFPAPEQAAIRQRVLRTAQATPLQVVQSSIRGMMDPAIWRDLPISVPLMVVVAKGPNWPRDYRARVERLNAEVEYEELEGVHHFLMLERPDLFNPLVIQFLRGLGALAG